MRDTILKAFKSHAQGHIDKHIANVEVLLEKPVGVEKEVRIIADYDDMLEMINKYFESGTESYVKK